MLIKADAVMHISIWWIDISINVKLNAEHPKAQKDLGLVLFI